MIINEILLYLNNWKFTSWLSTLGELSIMQKVSSMQLKMKFKEHISRTSLFVVSLPSPLPRLFTFDDTRQVASGNLGTSEQHPEDHRRRMESDNIPPHSRLKSIQHKPTKPMYLGSSWLQWLWWRCSKDRPSTQAIHHRLHPLQQQF